MTIERHMAWRTEGAGYGRLPARNPAHAPINWFETDYDDQFEDPDAPDPPDPLPTARHRAVPTDL